MSSSSWTWSPLISAKNAWAFAAPTSTSTASRTCVAYWSSISRTRNRSTASSRPSSSTCAARAAAARGAVSHRLDRVAQAFHRHLLDVAERALGRVGGGNDRSFESVLRRLAQTIEPTLHGAYLTRESDLTEHHQLCGQRPVAQTGQRGQHRREIGAGLGDTHAAHHVHEYVLIVHGDARMALQHRAQHREPVVIETDRHAARIRDMALRHQGLHLAQQRPCALARAHYHAARFLLFVACFFVCRGFGVFFVFLF